ncbi:hypothetical protein Cgig2_027256 [Carnegiea gigantea]|uniref:Uncharacterized protein n=1 Tax=Carnegiea gigantea TaxID=171969 RepID=A0A9Q1K274_9CARY|nr:hypothetical protein Cgig2_027256 [Carnegiea gigantea]
MNLCGLKCIKKPNLQNNCLTVMKALKALTYLVLGVWFWKSPVASIPRELVQPIGKGLAEINILRDIIYVLEMWNLDMIPLKRNTSKASSLNIRPRGGFLTWLTYGLEAGVSGDTTDTTLDLPLHSVIDKLQYCAWRNSAFLHSGRQEESAPQAAASDTGYVVSHLVLGETKNRIVYRL